MIKASAILLAFHSFSHDGEVPKVRPIDLSDANKSADVFEEAFKFGQNDFQPVAGCYSVSVGDLIEIEIDGAKEWRAVENAGFGAPMFRIGAIKFFRKALHDRATHQGIDPGSLHTLKPALKLINY